MAEAKRDIGSEILEGLREIRHGKPCRLTTIPSVASIRKGMGFPQSRFAELLGISVRTRQDWEEGHRAPSGAARTCSRSRKRIPRR